MVRSIIVLMAIALSSTAMASYRQSGLFMQMSGETGTYRIKGESKTNPALGVDLRLGTHSRAWRDFYRYVGVGASLYRLDAPNDIDVDSSDFDSDESNSYANVFAFGGIALNAPLSPFVELGLNGAQWLNGEYADEPNIGQNGFFKVGLDLKSRSGGWLQIFYKVSTTQDVGPLEKITTTGVTGGWAF